MIEDPKDTSQEEGTAEAPDGGPLHGGEGDPLGEGVEEASTDS